MKKLLLLSLFALNTPALAQTVLHGTKILDCHDSSHTFFLGVFEVTDHRTGKQYLELAATEWIGNEPLSLKVTHKLGSEGSGTKEYFYHKSNEYYLVVSEKNRMGNFSATWFGEKMRKLSCQYVNHKR